MIDLMQIPASEAERLAYMEGFKGTAELFRRIADMQEAAQHLLNALVTGGDREITKAADALREAIK